MAEAATDNSRWLADQHGLRFVDLTRVALAPGAELLLPESVARRHRVVPIGRRLGTPVIAVSDPGDLFAMDALRSNVGREFVVVVANSDQVARAIETLYGQGAGAAAWPPRYEAGSGAPTPPAGVPVVDGVGDATSPSTVGSAQSREGSGAPPTTLEESLRQVLAAPEPDTSPFTSNGVGGTGGTDGATGAAIATASGATELDAASLGATELDAVTLDETELDAVTLDEAVVDDAVVEAPSTEGAGVNGKLPSAQGAATEEEVPATSPEGPEEASSVPAEGEGHMAEPGTQEAAPTDDAPAPVEFAGPLLARALVQSGRVSAPDMTTALESHQQAGESLARYLYNQGLAKEEDLVWAMAQEVGLDFVDLNSVPLDQVAAALIPEATARHHMVLPIRVENGVPVVAMANPTDVFAMDDLRTIMGRNFTPVVATRTQIAHYLRQAYETDVDVSQVATDAEAGATGGSGFELESLQAVVEDAPIVRYVNLLILQALNERASDIHVEPTPRRLRIRFRIDGVMHDATSASSSISNAVVSRLKVLGDMDITEHRIPQEGRVSLTVSDRQIDLRLAVLPSIYGEKVVMRLLDKSASIRTLPDLGFLPDTLERYSKAYRQPYGVILVTGPTGAGKTTTLYATLSEVLTSEKSVVTVEDPVEYQIDGITQVQMNPKAGLFFTTALRSILRADPDIVLIGEIRDAETAKIAMEAALSGHLVLTTLHTNTAAATPLRLTEMGIEPFLVTSAVGSVLTQRLARKLCDNCKEPFDATEKDFFAAAYTESDLEGIDTSVLHRAVGCRACSHTGYIGRMVLAEVMNMSEQIDRMIIHQDSIVDIERKACEQGMRTLRQDGLLKAVSGGTTLEEVLRVVV